MIFHPTMAAHTHAHVCTRACSHTLSHSHTDTSHEMIRILYFTLYSPTRYAFMGTTTGNAVRIASAQSVLQGSTRLSLKGSSPIESADHCPPALLGGTSRFHPLPPLTVNAATALGILTRINQTCRNAWRKLGAVKGSASLRTRPITPPDLANNVPLGSIKLQPTINTRAASSSCRARLECSLPTPELMQSERALHVHHRRSCRPPTISTRNAPAGGSAMPPGSSR